MGRDNATDLCKEMMEFAHHPLARTIAQFLALKEIGWDILDQWRRTYPELNDAYQVMTAVLWCKWFDFAMSQDKLPLHQAKILEKYINLYDDHAIYKILQQNAKAEDAKAGKSFVAEDFSTLELSDQYKDKYDQNAKQRAAVTIQPDPPRGEPKAQ